MKRIRNFFPFLLILCLFFAAMVCFRLVLTHGPSMEPTLCAGDLVLCVRKYRPAQAGDIVLIDLGGHLVIKRVAAAEGEPAICVPPDADTPVRYSYWSSYPAELVPPGYLFVTGDNPKNSRDSRYPDFGLIRQEHVWGFVLGTIR